MKRMFTTVAMSLALVSTPVMAQSIEAQRAPAQVEEQSAEEFRGRGGGWVIGALALVVIVAGLIIALGGDDGEDLPTSP